MSSTPLLSSYDPSSKYECLNSLYPDLCKDMEPGWKDIIDRAHLIESLPGTLLAKEGESCKNFMLLLSGTIRIYQTSEDGREVTLYRINPGDVCLMSLNSLLHNRPFRANASTESDVKMLMISIQDFHRGMEVSKNFRNIILTSLVDTMCSMVHSFYDTAFETLDMRLACLLARLFERANSDVLNVTHQEIAQELGTSREVISRLLKKLEKQNFVILKRGQILLGENKNMPGRLAI